MQDDDAGVLQSGVEGVQVVRVVADVVEHRVKLIRIVPGDRPDANLAVTRKPVGGIIRDKRPDLEVFGQVRQ